MLAEEAVDRKLHRTIDEPDSDEEPKDEDLRKKHADKVAKRQRESSDRELKATHSELYEIVDGPCVIELIIT